jgi:hypothetical protein
VVLVTVTAAMFGVLWFALPLVRRRTVLPATAAHTGDGGDGGPGDGGGPGE